MTKIRRSNLLPQNQPFDYQLAMDCLRDYHAPRDKLRHLCTSGEIIRVRKGLYVSGLVDPLVLAGLICGPSYVSLETALSREGLIPERVEEITCITTKRSKMFNTPVGRFRYKPVSERVFSIGIRLEHSHGGAFFIAEPEKALCDRLAMMSGLTALRDVPSALEDDLRVDVESVVSTFRLPLVEEIATSYHRKSITAFYRWLKGLQKRLPTFTPT